MSEFGKTQIIIMWVVGPDDVAEADRLFEGHAEWMKGHPREGDTALPSYSISKGPELANPLDPNSDPTGNMVFVLDEVYESPAGVPRHWQDAMENWEDLGRIVEMSARGTVTTLHSGTIVQSLW